MRKLLRLLRGTRGSTITEFAIVCPVLLVLLLGFGDMAYQGYIQDVLTGAVQKAGRDSTIEGAATQLATIDAKVEAPIRAIAPTATFSSTRESYANFTSVAPEPFIDTNGNGKRDPGECYSDINNNQQWDADPGAAGQGGAGDVAVYTMKVTFPRLFPLGQLLGWGDMLTISSTTILKNQPYANQVQAAVTTRCN